MCRGAIFLTVVGIHLILEGMTEYFTESKMNAIKRNWSYCKVVKRKGNYGLKI